MAQFTRRQFIQSGVAAGGTLGLQWATGIPLARAVAGGQLAKYVEPLPVPGKGIVVAKASALNAYSFTQRQIFRKLHPQLPPTPIWAYDDGNYIDGSTPTDPLKGQAGSFGMAVVAQSGTPLTMRFTNTLPATYPTWLPVDTRLTIPTGSNQVRLMTHLHGGFVAGDSDGNPVTHHGEPPGFAQGQTQTVFYPNEQPASMLWFHDHGMGTTRLNVFAGLAAGYIIRDTYDDGADGNPIPDPNKLGIPGGAYEIPLVIQDRSFDALGNFLYPVSAIPGVTWIGEYFGDVMLVNGKVWPYLDVEPRLYRLRILNGCNARILNLDFGGAKTWQIGAESGMFDIPVPMKQFVLAPAERADIIIDFRAKAGTNMVVKNADPPKPVVTPAPSLTTVMQIRVGTTVKVPGPASVPPTLLGGKKANVLGPVVTTPPKRYITLNEVNPMTVSWYANLNGVHFHETATETPMVGTVEDWVYINLTPDTHPMHVHLVKFEIIGRTPFNVNAYMAGRSTLDGVPGGIDPTPYATGSMQPPAPEERGWKDTVKANPGYFTTIRMRFDLPAEAIAQQKDQHYVHHCHIVEHEDNDMMRPFIVKVPPPSA
jgi:spore coat protein A, manganese oxidase